MEHLLIHTAYCHLYYIILDEQSERNNAASMRL